MLQSQKRIAQLLENPPSRSLRSNIPQIIVRAIPSMVDRAPNSAQTMPSH